MSGITQFEVYVLQHGRWTIHARFPGEERKEAILDARTTEASTHFPTKVVRETYFPDINDSERVTVYLSPNAKVQATAASPLRRAPMCTPSAPMRQNWGGE